MTLQELGIMLRTEREKRGLAIDDVAGRLKISARVLRALEEGDTDGMPHAVYVRGFIRSYANYLGIDPEHVQAVTELMDTDDNESPAVPVYAQPEVEKGRRSGRIFLLVFLLMCLVGLGLAWLYRDADLFSELQQARLTTAQPAPPLNPAPAPQKAEKTDKKTKTQQSSAAAVPTTQQSTPAATSENAATGQVTNTSQVPASSQTPARQEPTPFAPATQGAPMSTLPAATQSQTPPINGPHKIIITALAECWIHSTADSTDTRQFSLRKGDTFALTFTHKLVLKLGNAGGVRLRYNGQDLAVQGKEGQVKTITFPMSE